jgi:flagellar hook-basal body complex protein FliE
MTSPIGGIGSIGSLTGLSGIGELGASGNEAATGPNSDFASLLSNSLKNVQELQSKSNELAVQVADGTLQDPAQYTMASTEAGLALDLTMAVRNKAVEAFQEIMRMQA